MAAADDAKQGDASAASSTKPIAFTMEESEFISTAASSDKRKIMIALDGTDFSKKAAEWVNDNLAKDDDCILLVSVWEEGMVEKLQQELDSEIIHPNPSISHSKHTKLNDTFEPARCLADHAGVSALLLPEGRVTSKTIGEELVHLATEMKVNTLVCGTRGLGVIKKAFLGSVSSYISENSPCTAVIVR